MEKAYLVYGSWGICDDSSVVGVFLDEIKADAYVEEHGRQRKEEEQVYEKCHKCRRDREIFEFKNTCDKAEIKTDRHGLYCENDMSDWYNCVGSNSYWKEEVDIIR
jgi:hypothetical protein